MASPLANPRSVDRKSQPQNWVGSKAVLSKEAFHQMILLEQRRSERTQRPFALVLMDTGRLLPIEKNVRTLLNTLSALQAATRETDLMGWYETNVSVGVMFTEITLDNNLIPGAILSRLDATLWEKLTTEQFSQIKFSCHLFPEEFGRINPVSEKSVGLPLRHMRQAVLL